MANRPRLAYWLLIAHTTCLVAATLLAVVSYPSLVVSGPILCASGALIASISCRADRLVGFLLGLAAPTLGVSCLLAVSLVASGASRIRSPICAVLALFSVACVALCARAVSEIRTTRAAEERQNPCYYSVACLALLALVVAGFLSLGQTPGARVSLLAVFGVYVAVLVYVVDGFFAVRRQRLQPEPGLFPRSGPAGHVSDAVVPASRWSLDGQTAEPRPPRSRRPVAVPRAIRAMSRLLIAHAIAILFAVVFAIIEIETIVISGPILSVSGALIGFISFGRDRFLGLLFGMSAPTVAVFCLFVIATLEWAPADAQIPVGTLLFVIGLLSMPACALAVQELYTSGNTGPRTHFQFSIAALLVLMAVLAIALGLAQTGDQGVGVGISLAYLVVLVYVMNQFFRNRRLQRLARVSSLFGKRE